MPLSPLGPEPRTLLPSPTPSPQPYPGSWVPSALGQRCWRQAVRGVAAAPPGGWHWPWSPSTNHCLSTAVPLALGRDSSFWGHLWQGQEPTPPPVRATSGCQLCWATGCRRQPETISPSPLGSTVTIPPTRISWICVRGTSGVRFLRNGLVFIAIHFLLPHCYCILWIGKSVCNGLEVGGGGCGQSPHIVWNVVLGPPCIFWTQLSTASASLGSLPGLHLVVCMWFFIALFEKWFFPP